MDRELPKSSNIKEFPAGNIPSQDAGTQYMITVWKTICEEFKNRNLAWEGMKLDPARKKSVRRQKHSVHKRGGAGRGWWGRGENRRER